MSKPSCWIIYDKGKVGTGNQCLGLAEALGFEPVVYEVTAHFPWNILPSSFWYNPLKCVTHGKRSYLEGPWPDVIIGAGRASAAPVAAIGKLSAHKTITIQILNPRLPSHMFDVVVTPAHDLYAGPNVIQTKGALHRLTKQRLSEESQKFSKQVQKFARPFVLVLIGGASRRFQLDEKVIADLKNKLQHWVNTYGVSLAILPSRRTSEENRKSIEVAFKDMPAVVWDCASENPYLGYLELADYIVVTSDSASMTSEACYTGKPVYIYHLPGGAAIFDRFHEGLEQAGYTRPLGEILESWNYPPLDEMTEVASQIKNQPKFK